MSIYATKGKSLEYAPFGLDIYKTCPHGCLYCYNTTQSEKSKKPEEFHAGAVPIMRSPEKLRKSIATQAERFKAISAEDKRVLLSFGSDPYPAVEESMEITKAALELLVEYGVPFQTLTKNPRVALRDIDLFKKGDGRFASTVLFLDENLREKWEPGAPPVAERLECLKEAHDQGVFTWVSVEPVISTRQAISLIEEASDYVDLWKVGKLNHHPLADTIDWKDFANSVHWALLATDKSFIIKNSLAAYLPAGKRWSRIIYKDSQKSD